jgi:DNA helicase IV
MTKRGINNFFSQNQKKIYAFKEYTECTKEEQKFGLARLNDGSIVVSCRCEKASCIHFDECMNEPNAKRITRVKVNNDETDQDPDSFILPEMEFIKIDFNENKILEQAFDDDEGDEKIKEVHDKEKEFVSPINTVEYKPVETPDEIIKAPYGEKIFINAGPGTGKTYSIIERINYFTINHQDKMNNILVLSFTNAAKRVVEQRIEDGIKKGALNPSAKNIIISTLDSLATYFLF